MSAAREGQISQEIYQGTMGRYLVYPMSYLYMKYVQFLSVATFHLFKFFIVITALILYLKNPDFISINAIPTYLALVLLAMHFLFFIFVILECMAFWVDNVWSLQVILRTSLQILGGLYAPLVFFPSAMQIFLELSPLSHCIFTPAMCLLGKHYYSLGVAFSSLSLGILLLALLLRWIWKKGLVRFEGSGM